MDNTRRSFLKKVSLGSIAAVGVPSLATPESLLGRDYNSLNDVKFQLGRTSRDFNDKYENEYLSRVAFPIGGLGAGMFCLEGTGAISHLSVNNKPAVFNVPYAFGAISVKGNEKGAKVLESNVPTWKIFGPLGAGNGLGERNYGFPRFETGSFLARFPFAIIDLKDKDIPMDVKIVGWSPFIPTDQDNSSLPVGVLEYRFKNTSEKNVEAVFSYNARNFIDNKGQIKKVKNGFLMTKENSTDGNKGFSIYLDDDKSVIDYCWFRGGWFDSQSILWENIKNGRTVSNPPIEGSSPGASIYLPFTLKPNEERVIKVNFCWYLPESDISIAIQSEKGEKQNNETDKDTFYRPWYSERFKGINEVVKYWNSNYQILKKNSELFRDAFYSSTLPAEVLEAVAANLTIIKSPTVLRQYDGRLWAWEGCSDNSGCCHGSCTHVWNYAQAIPHLFPALERTLRDTEFKVSQNEEGHQNFRTNLPITPTKHDFHAASDGQLGGIMKLYRDWRISGNTSWMKELYPYAKKSIDYCIRTWDPKRKGCLEEPHHNTYDIEFWGPDGMCTSFYLGALTAFIEMSKSLKEPFKEYEILLTKGKKYMEQELYNGEYFIQKIVWEGLQAPNPVDLPTLLNRGNYSDEALELLKKEGPKYQYGTGCLSDGILGMWIASVCGLKEVVDDKKTTNHLKAVHKYNLKTDLTDHYNPQRPTYAYGNEGGLLLCSWPKGGALSLPFVYSNEVWTGIEYQVASHLMFKGEVEKGLEIVRECRKRYDGSTRNPFNEYECGHWYARAMASYGMLQGLTGVRYDAVERTMYIDSKVGDFTTFISTDKGFGTVSLMNGKPLVEVVFGNIDIKNYIVSGKKMTI
jgi:uncharacterized protein (DUF608 family)